MGEPKTVRVRIAVAVNTLGKWIATGVCGGTDSDAQERASRFALTFTVPYVTNWIEADVPLPLEPQVIQGSVSTATEGAQ